MRTIEPNPGIPKQHSTIGLLTYAGPHIGQLPPATSLPHSLQTLPTPPPLIQSNPNPQPCLPSISQLLSNLTSEGQILPAAVEPAPTPPLSLGHGLPSVSKKVAARILAGEYIDFAELPPARGKVKSLPAPDGSVIIVQAQDLLQQKRLIPDIATWIQCFAIYVSIVCSPSPERLNDMLGYMCHIVRASHRFKWPSWVVYDQNFRSEAADNGTKEWARIDPSLYAQCFMGQARSEEAWCRSCHLLDHNSDTAH